MGSSQNNQRKWWVLLSIGIGTFMTALDTSVVNTVLPVIGKNFQSQVANVEWVVTIYLLGLSALLLSFGRLGDMRGHKIIYIWGFIVFVGSSMLCGLAPSVLTLVICRGLQAFGAAMLAANSPAILTKSFPTEQRGRALGLQATMTYLGLTVGPSFGGWLASVAGWRTVFYINLPVGILAIWLSLRSIPNDKGYKTGERFDWMGAVLFVIALSALLLGLNQGHNWGWDSPRTLILLAGAVLLFMLFYWTERRAANPMLDLGLFNQHRFSMTTASAVLNYIGIYSAIFLMPFYLIQGRLLSSAEAGLLLTAQPIVMAVVAPLSGTLSDRWGTRWPAVIGMAVLSFGLYLLAQLGPESSTLTIALSLGVMGLGTGTFISPNNSALMGAAPRHRQGIAAGILATARNFGMVMGVGISGSIFTSMIAYKAGNTGLGEVGGDVFFHAIQVSFMIAAGIAFIGVFTSATRIEQPTQSAAADNQQSD
jgi:EmrB/QacA subfamily drug resistance transporter